MRAIEPWVEPPLREFLDESQARVALLMTTSGQVIAQHGFTRSLDVMAAAALGAGIVASTAELARLLGAAPYGALVHEGPTQGSLLASFDTPRGRWIALAVFGPETSVGLVQLFFERMAAALAAGAPAGPPPAPVLAENFERELGASLRALFSR